MKQRHITNEQRNRLLQYEESPNSPDMRIPIPADGYAFPSDFCYEDEAGYLIDDAAYVFAQRRKFVWESTEDTADTLS